MGLTSLQVCIDSTDWLQGTIHDENGMDSSSSPSGDMLTCSRPLIERRLRPPHDQALKCPRCDSTHTKFCYYNNYSLSQPRYFCKTCRRYWTKGGTLRNIPVGGGCRKNKKVSKKASSDTPMSLTQNPGIGSSSSTDLHLSFPHEVQLSHLNSVLGVQGTLTNPTFMESSKYNNMCGLIDQHPHRNVDFMETKLEAMMGSGSSSSSRNNYDIMGSMNGELGVINNGLATNFHGGFCSPYGMSLDHGNYGNGGSGGAFMESCQRFMLPYDQGNCSHDNDTEVDVKPRLLSLEWHNEQDCLNNMGSWSGMMNGGGYGPSATNPLM